MTDFYFNGAVASGLPIIFIDVSAWSMLFTSLQLMSSTLVSKQWRTTFRFKIGSMSLRISCTLLQLPTL